MRLEKWVGFAIVCGVLAGCGEKASVDNAAAVAEDHATGEVTFASAKTIFEGRCAKCHVGGKKGGLTLDTLETTMAGGESGAVVVPGDSNASLLFAMVSGVAEKRMPPKGDPLSADELATIKAWIDGGAK